MFLIGLHEANLQLKMHPLQKKYSYFFQKTYFSSIVGVVSYFSFFLFQSSSVCFDCFLYKLFHTKRRYFSPIFDGDKTKD